MRPVRLGLLALVIVIVVLVAAVALGGRDGGGDAGTVELDDQRLANSSAAVATCVRRTTGIQVDDDFLVTGDLEALYSREISPQAEADLEACLERILDTVEADD